MIDITPIVEAVIALIAALITCFLIPYIKSHTTAKQLDTLYALISVAVAAAEQLYEGSGRGEEKLAYVLKWLEANGVTVDSDDILTKIRAMIESAVYELGEETVIIVEDEEDSDPKTDGE